MMVKCILILAMCMVSARASLPAQPELRFSSLGDFHLENGAVITNCRVGYRTCGRLNSDSSNVILFPTWYTGTTRDLLGFVGEGKYIDTNKYFVVLVDALGNGISSSPSNSPAQADTSFPYFSIQDLVRSQYMLVTSVLKIPRLYTIIGASMGGMQAFQWAISYPAFAKKIIPIVGSPRLAPYDILEWKTEERIIKDMLTINSAESGLLVDLMGILLSTPEEFDRSHSREGVDSLITQMLIFEQHSFNPHNRLRQLRAMIGHDISAQYGYSLEKAAERISAKLLIVVATKDRVVVPEPAEQFAHLCGGKLLELDSDCAHGAFYCETGKISAAIQDFLSKER